MVPIAADVDIGSNTNADGFDIRFTSSNGTTELYFDRISHTVTDGRLDALYVVGSPLEYNTDTYIYIYYKLDDTENGENRS